MTSKIDLKERIEYVVNLNAALLERSGYNQEAYCRVVLNAMVQTPAIAECDMLSLQQALLAAMNAGLVPDGKEAVIVPFKGKATLVPCIKGMIKLVQQARPGTVLRVMAVFAGDKWDYAEGLHHRLNHVPSPTASQAPEEVIYAYATARLPGAMEPMYDVMSRGEIDRYRSYSRSPAWSTNFVEQCKNPVLRRLLKRLPMSGLVLDAPTELEHVDTLEDAASLVESPSTPSTSGACRTVDTSTGEITDGPEPAAPRASKPKSSLKPAPQTAGYLEVPDDDEAPF